MRRLHINLTVALITFVSAVAADSFLHYIKSKAVAPEAVIKPAEVKENVSTYAPQEQSDDQYVFDNGRFMIVSEEVHLKSKRLRYDIDVRYPQVMGNSDSQVRDLNRRIKSLVKAEYEWPLNPSMKELNDYLENWPEVFNSVELDYEILAAHNSIVSFYLNEYSYGIGAAHSVQTSHPVNYDLNLRRALQLSDLFKPGSKYLAVISRRCATELAVEALSERSTFENWNLTRDGIRINFQQCEVLSCAAGEQKVEIPFIDLKPFLNSKFASFGAR